MSIKVRIEAIEDKKVIGVIERYFPDDISYQTFWKYLSARVASFKPKPQE